MANLGAGIRNGLQAFKAENIEANEEKNMMCREFLNHLKFNQVVGSLDLNYSPFFGSIESCMVLGEVVRTSKTLSNLSLHGSGLTGDGLEYIIMGLLSNPNTVLGRLEIGSNIKLGTKGAELVELLLLRNLPTLQVLGIWGAGFSPEETAPVAKALAKNTTLRQLSCGVGYGITHADTEGPMSWILKALTPVDFLTPEQASFQDNTYNTTVQILSINYEYEKGIAENLLQMLAHNSSLEALGLRFFQFTREQWAKVWDALKYNTDLKAMDLYQCGQGLGDAFTDLMELLQANRTLRKIELGQTPLEVTGQSALVKEQLNRNARLADCLGTLIKSVEFVPPKIGRLFLCGYPRAGKTSLRRSMVATQGDLINRVLFSATASMARLCCQVFVTYYDPDYGISTRGIEIRLLKDSKDKHIAVWDMAGQEEYHALHDSHYMFPDINQACIFLFLYRPEFDVRGIWHEENSIRKLEFELCYWLSFINSNSRKTGWVLPQLSVVLTHLDKLSLRFGMDEKKRAQRYADWASRTVHVLRKDFAGRVDLDIQVHAVDSSSIQHARGVVDHVFGRFDHLFSKTLPEVPAVCEEMNLFLARWTATHDSCPIITQKEFFRLCRQNVRGLEALFEEVPPELANEAQEIRESYLEKNQLAVAVYLHDVGSIIHFPKSTFVVVDPNWLGKVFLGELFRPGDDSYQPIIRNTRNGCVSYGDLMAILEDFIQTRNYRGFKSGDLIELMKEMKLCYEEESDPGSDPPAYSYFIPSTLSDPEGLAQQGKRKLKWAPILSRGSTPVYSGLRLQCLDQSRTFLSPGFFQRFQVHLQTFLRDQGKEYRIEKNLIRVKHDGLELLVEKSGDHSLLDGDFVDILAKSYNPAVNDGRDLFTSVVDKLKLFCASREGCPGVALQEAIIRPKCVEKLTLCYHRKNQAVVKETLKQKVTNQLFESDQLEIWRDGGYSNTVTEVSQIYKHFFPAVPFDSELPEEFVETTDMLSIKDVKDAIFKYRTIISEKKYAVFQAVDDVQRVTMADISHTSRAIPGASGSPSPASDTQGPASDTQGPPDGPEWWRSFQNEIEKKNQDFLVRQLRDLGAAILSKLEEQRILLGHIKNSMEDMQMLHQRFYSTVIEKLDLVMGLTAELQAFPGLPYFSDKQVNWTHRLVAFIQIGTPIKLHFMCENPSGPHYVKNQMGLPLTGFLTGDTYKRLRPLILGSLKVLFILVKAGLHVAAGLGDVIGDATTNPYSAPLILTGLTGEALMDNIANFDSACDGIDSTLADAWAFLQTIMAPMQARGEISATFQLYQVQFKSKMLHRYLEKRTCFWLCDKCRNEADQADLLTNLTNMTAGLHPNFGNR